MKVCSYTSTLTFSSWVNSSSYSVFSVLLLNVSEMACSDSANQITAPHHTMHAVPHLCALAQPLAHGACGGVCKETRVNFKRICRAFMHQKRVLSRKEREKGGALVA